MFDEMSTLESNPTWELIPLPSQKIVFGYKQVFNANVDPDGQIS